MAPNFYNPTNGPLVVDDEGHTIGGREHAELKATDHTNEHVAAGRLIQASKVTKTATPKPAATTEED